MGSRRVAGYRVVVSGSQVTASQAHSQPFPRVLSQSGDLLLLAYFTAHIIVYLLNEHRGTVCNSQPSVKSHGAPWYSLQLATIYNITWLVLGTKVRLDPN